LLGRVEKCDFEGISPLPQALDSHGIAVAFNSKVPNVSLPPGILKAKQRSVDLAVHQVASHLQKVNVDPMAADGA
jgi:hypothetical protein